MWYLCFFFQLILSFGPIAALKSKASSEEFQSCNSISLIALRVRASVVWWLYDSDLGEWACFGLTSCVRTWDLLLHPIDEAEGKKEIVEK